MHADAQNEDGDTALHWAMRAGRIAMRAVQVLLENGARPATLNHRFRRPVDVAADGFPDNPFDNHKKLPADNCNNNNNNNKKGRLPRAEYRRRKAELVEERRDVRGNLFARSAQSRSLVLYHPECQEHIPKSDSDWEAPDRVTAIMRRLIPDAGSTESTGVFPHEVTVSSEFERATLDLLSRVHSADYLAFVNDLSKELSRRSREEDEGDSGKSTSVVPFTPMVSWHTLYIVAE